MTRAPNVVKREEIIQQLWGEEAPSADILRSHMYQLRNQIDKPFDYPLIVTVPKIGFKLESPIQSEWQGATQREEFNPENEPLF